MNAFTFISHKKKHLVIFMFLMLSLLFVAACANISNKQETVVPEQNLRDFAYSLKVQSSCEAENGRWQKVGRIQQFACILPTSDAGKACKNKSECQVACIINDTSFAADTAVTGQCHDSTHLFGCRTYVNNGRVEHTLCID